MEIAIDDDHGLMRPFERGQQEIRGFTRLCIAFAHHPTLMPVLSVEVRSRRKGVIFAKSVMAHGFGNGSSIPFHRAERNHRYQFANKNDEAVTGTSAAKDSRAAGGDWKCAPLLRFHRFAETKRVLDTCPIRQEAANLAALQEN